MTLAITRTDLTAEHRYSHVVATDDLCLDVICIEEPVVTIDGADDG